MENSPKIIKTNCLNCNATVTGDFCGQCGQHVRDNSDRSIRHLLADFFKNVLFFDNRFFISIRFLLCYPSLMTVEFLKGKRKKFISPVTLFLFVNLVYFFVNPLSDYSLSLYDQINSQPYSVWIKNWVEMKLQAEGLSEQAYSIEYQTKSDSISKSIMIINTPIIAFFVYLITFKKRKFYYDSLIFSIHFFSLFIISWIMLDWADSIIDFLPNQVHSLVSSISFNLFTLIIPLLYAILGVKRFMNIPWYWAIPAGFGVTLAVFFANFFYRFIIFLTTFWST